LAVDGEVPEWLLALHGEQYNARLRVVVPEQYAMRLIMGRKEQIKEICTVTEKVKETYEQIRYVTTGVGGTVVIPVGSEIYACKPETANGQPKKVTSVFIPNVVV